MSRQPRFEVVRSDAGWFARFVAANGREVWRTSETYQRQRAAVHAVVMLTYNMGSWADVPETRQVDERTP